MRHRKSGRKLKRTASHRRATLAALVTALLRHKRITTTVAKAKETRMVVEKLITRARNAVAQKSGDAAAVSESPRREQFLKAAGNARRLVGRLVKDRAVVAELFSDIAEKIGARPGGYTRIVKLGQRQGDGAEMAVIELVDYNTGKESKEKPAPTVKEKKARQPKKAKKPAGPSPSAVAPEKTGPEGEKAAGKKKKGSPKEKPARESH